MSALPPVLSRLVCTARQALGERMGVLRRLATSRQGAGAVEFALIAPILLSVYVSAFEVTVAMNLGRKVSRTSGAVSDIVTQQSTVNKAFLTTMVDAARSNLAPYQPTSLSMKITGIRIDATSQPTVLWSWDQGGGRPYTVGAVVNGMPADLVKPSSFVVRSEISVPHTVLLFLSYAIGQDARTLTITREFYFRQRVGTEVACSDC